MSDEKPDSAAEPLSAEKFAAGFDDHILAHARYLSKDEDGRRLTLKGLDLTGIILEGLELKRSVIVGCNLSKANGRGASFVDADLFGSNFQSADMMKADFRGADLRGANFELAELSYASLRSTDLRPGRLAEWVGMEERSSNLYQANLNSADFTGSDMTRANLSTASAQKAKFADVEMFAANLAGVNLKGADLSSCALNQVNLTGAVLEGADMRGRASETRICAMWTCRRSISPASICAARSTAATKNPCRRRSRNCCASIVCGLPRTAIPDNVPTCPDENCKDRTFPAVTFAA